MAGGKETPRQRMIGLMYLVLTCMLALQVSNTVLDKFIFIDESLQRSNGIANNDNNRTIDAISQTASQRGSVPAIQQVMNDAMKVKEETKQILSMVAEMRTKMIEVSGGYEDPVAKRGYKGGKDYDAVMNYTIGAEGKKDGAAYVLQAKLNAYVESLNKIGTSWSNDSTGKFVSIPKIARDGKEIPEYANAKDQAMRENINKDFAYLQFDHTPMVAALAVMSQIESEVLQAESKVLSVLAKKVDAKVDFDKVRAVVRPESKFVAAGTKYKASMFIAASSSSIRPKMTYNGSAIRVADGLGEIEFTATPGQYDDAGKAKKQWNGTITYATPFGDTTLTISEEYYVVKPTIDIKSTTVNALYRNCDNQLEVDVPALGQAYQPNFSASGASVSSRGKVASIVPDGSSKKVTLTVKSGGDLIGSKEFDVRGIPKPDVVLLSNGKKIDERMGIPNTSSNISVRIVPNEEFAALLPKEANYAIASWEVTAAAGKKLIGTQKGNGPSVSISGLMTELASRPGGRLVVEIKSVKRKNSRGEIEEVRGMNGLVYNIPVN